MALILALEDSDQLKVDGGHEPLRLRWLARDLLREYDACYLHAYKTTLAKLK